MTKSKSKKNDKLVKLNKKGKKVTKIQLTSIQNDNDTLIIKTPLDIETVCKLLSNANRVQILKNYDGVTKTVRIADNLNKSLPYVYSHMKPIKSAKIRLIDVDVDNNVRIYSRKYDYILIDLTLDK